MVKCCDITQGLWVSLQDRITVEQPVVLMQASELSRPIGCKNDFVENYIF